MRHSYLVYRCSVHACMPCLHRLTLPVHAPCGFRLFTYMKQCRAATPLASLLQSCENAGVCDDVSAHLVAAAIGGQCTAWSFVTFLVTKGLYMITANFLVGTASSLMIIRYHRKLQGGSDTHADGSCSSSGSKAEMNGHSSDDDFLSQRPYLLPFASFGLHYDSGRLAPLGAFFKKLAPCLASLAGSIDDSIVIAVICLPISLLCWARIMLTRVLPQVGDDDGRLTFHTPTVSC